MTAFYQDYILVALPIFFCVLFLNWFTNVAGNVQVSPQILTNLCRDKRKIFLIEIHFQIIDHPKINCLNRTSRSIIQKSFKKGTLTLVKGNTALENS